MHKQPKKGTRLTIASCIAVLIPILLIGFLLLMYFLNQLNWAYLVIIFMVAPLSMLVCGIISIICSTVAIKHQRAKRFNIVLLLLAMIELLIGVSVLMAFVT